jgi:hypothetical protein
VLAALGAGTALASLGRAMRERGDGGPPHGSGRRRSARRGRGA